jgi:hypothetical protein
LANSNRLYFGFCAGIHPRRCAVYLQKSDRASAARVISARSYADVS